MGKRGKRRRRSGNLKHETAFTSSTDDVIVTTDDGCHVSAWKSAVFRAPPFDADVASLRQCWQRLEQRKRRSLTPTPIQLHVWPVLIQSRKSVVGIASTGSGKTLAYGLYLASQVHTGNALVLLPTRELARQVERELSAVSDKTIICIYGGIDRTAQSAALTQAIQNDKPWIVTATTGRFVDVMQDETMPSFVVDSIIVDEADRMASNVDIVRQVDEILQLVRSIETSRVSLFSATCPTNVQDKWTEWTGESRVCVKVNTVTIGGTSVPFEADNTGVVSTSARARNELDFSKIPSNITQILHVCAAHKKPRKLIATLQKIRNNEGRQKGLCLVFFSRIKTLQYVSKLLNQEGYKAAEFHSQLDQSMREKRLMNFKSGKQPTLLATDIAARGIHVNNIEYAINYDFPVSLDQYIHRCGRAARDQSSSATVYSFFTRDFAPMASDVLALLESSNAWIDPNLVKLVGTDGRPSKKQRRERDDKHRASPNDTQGYDSNHGKGPQKEDLGDGDADDWDDGQFANLNANSIVLHRADHVSEASETDSPDDDSSA